jgi:hypothetical protein
MRFVELKSEAQLDMQGLHRVRDRVREVHGPHAQLVDDLRLLGRLQQRATVPRQVAKIVHILDDPSSWNYRSVMPKE